MRHLLLFLLVLSLAIPLSAGEKPVLEFKLNPAQVKKLEITPTIGPLKGLLEKTAVVTKNGMEFDGTNSIDITGEIKNALPQESFSAEACVVIQKTQAWGGILSYFQDNGSFEKGWLLGYKHNKFLFQVSNGPKLITLLSDVTFEPNKWYCVTGTYDGKTMKLYVDGKLAGTSAGAKGEIEYPPKGFFTIGAYRDDNEFFRMTGRIRQVALFHTGLSEPEIKARLLEDVAIPMPLEFAVVPAIQFTSRTEAILTWNATTEGKYGVEYGFDGKLTQNAEVEQKKSGYEAKLTGLTKKGVYNYRIICQKKETESLSEVMSLEMTQNYSVPNLSDLEVAKTDGELAETAKSILSAAGFRTGSCLVYGIKDGKLITELVADSKLQIIGVDDDQQRIDAVRQALYKQKLYGQRINSKYVKDLSKLPFVGNTFNLIVSERDLGSAQLAASGADLARVLCPGERSAICVPQSKSESAFVSWLKDAKIQSRESADENWLVFRKNKREGIGSWTHQYATAGNTAYGGETLAGASSTSQLQVQWFGLPGGDFGIDRQVRMPAPLAANGRLFHQGMDRMIALDSNNGVVLWSLEIPDLRRTNLPRDAGNWCCDDDAVYVAVRDQLWKIDARTGKKLFAISVPPPGKGKEWGYVARHSDFIFGSTAKKDSSYRKYWGGNSWYDSVIGKGNNKVCSETLFAMAKQSGKLIWTYTEGLIINTSIVLDGKNAFFVESRNPELNELTSSRIVTADLWKNLFLVSLDCKTGKKRWEKSLDIVCAETVFYAELSDNHILLCSSAPTVKNNTQGKYNLYCFDGKTGKRLWQQSHPWTRSNHSGHMQHPVIVDGRVFLKPRSYDLKTGKVVDERIGMGGKCSTYSASKYALFYRTSTIALWGIESKKASTWRDLRPSCWLSTIIADGMVLAPEGGAGCSCGRWFESSIAFSPVSSPEER